MRTALLSLLAAGLASSQTPAIRETAFEGQPALVLSNQQLEVTVTVLGASLARLALPGDPAAPNPLWEPVRMARELGKDARFQGSTGHFVCVDGFGPVSEEERAAGLPGHGEAHRQLYKVVRSGPEGNGVAVSLEAVLPVVQEKFTRTLRLVEGENVLYVESRLENLLGFDRPVNWAEHATVGSPFLAPGETVVDVSGRRSMTRPYAAAPAGQVTRRLQSGVEFSWPLAPGVDGGSVDLRETPRELRYLDHATTLVDSQVPYGWTTALNTAKRLIVGWVFRREEFPWVQYWGQYPPTGKLARGLEFSTQPFDVPRREAITTATMFGAPTYRWLPAKSSITARFLVFYARAPEGMRRVDAITVERGKLIIEDRASGRSLTLAASLAE